jgi:hypothetical protein
MTTAIDTPPKTGKEVSRRVVRARARTAEDHLLIALERDSLDDIVRILRDWFGANEIRRSLSKLHHRDPVSRFVHARRHAVALYARDNGLVPANLLVEIRGTEGRSDPKGAERYKLRKASEYLELDAGALAGAEALASHWKQKRPPGIGHAAYLRRFLMGSEF